jgi:hypothetical protein
MRVRMRVKGRVTVTEGENPLMLKVEERSPQVWVRRQEKPHWR